MHNNIIIGIMCGVFTLYYNHSHSNTYETADIIYFQNKCYVHKFVHSTYSESNK